MPRVKFIREYRLGIATADGPDERIFTEGETVDLTTEHAAVYVAGGFAVLAGDQTKPFDRMKKDELLAFAAERGIVIDDDATKAQIIEALTA